MNKTIPAVAAAALALYLDRSARRRHREHMRALRLYRTSVNIHDVTMYARPDTPGPFIGVGADPDDVLTPTVAARIAAAAREAKPSWLSKPAPAVDDLDDDGDDE